MINNLSSGKYILVTGSASPYIDMSNPSAGMIRMNGSILEAYNGYSWVPISSSPMVSLTPEAELLLDWAKSKREEDLKIENLCQSNPALAKAKDNYEIIKRLVASEEKLDIL